MYHSKIREINDIYNLPHPVLENLQYGITIKITNQCNKYHLLPNQTNLLKIIQAYVIQSARNETLSIPYTESRSHKITLTPSVSPTSILTMNQYHLNHQQLTILSFLQMKLIVRPSLQKKIQRGIKKHNSAFCKLMDSKQQVAWRMHTVAQTKAQQVDDIIDPDCKFFVRDAHKRRSNTLMILLTLIVKLLFQTPTQFYNLNRNIRLQYLLTSF